MFSNRWRILALIAGLLAPAGLSGQSASLSFGAAGVTRYVWRGFLYSSTFQIQPTASITLGSLEIGTWGSYGVDLDYKEQDQWITWSTDLPRGSLALTINDYYFTDDFSDFFDFHGVENGAATGAHTLEAVVAYSGPERFPIELTLASTFYNDPRASVYAEIGYSASTSYFDWGAQAGYLLQDGGYYETGDSGLANLSLSATRSLPALGDRSPYVSGYLIRNQLLHRTYAVLEIGF